MKIKNQSTVLHKVYVLTLLVVLLMSLTAPVAADGVAEGKKMFVSPNQAQGPSDAAEMEAFMDELFARHMEENHIAGAAV